MFISVFSIALASSCKLIQFTHPISLILSIISLKDLGKFSSDIKNTSEYRSIRNKNIIALCLAGFATFMWITSLIEQIMNPTNYDDLYNSILNELENAGV